MGLSMGDLLGTNEQDDYIGACRKKLNDFQQHGPISSNAASEMQQQQQQQQQQQAFLVSQSQQPPTPPPQTSTIQQAFLQQQQQQMRTQAHRSQQQQQQQQQQGNTAPIQPVSAPMPQPQLPGAADASGNNVYIQQMFSLMQRLQQEGRQIDFQDPATQQLILQQMQQQQQQQQQQTVITDQQQFMLQRNNQTQAQAQMPSLFQTIGQQPTANQFLQLQQQPPLPQQPQPQSQRIQPQQQNQSRPALGGGQIPSHVIEYLMRGLPTHVPRQQRLSMAMETLKKIHQEGKMPDLINASQRASAQQQQIQQAQQRTAAGRPAITQQSAPPMNAQYPPPQQQPRAQQQQLYPQQQQQNLTYNSATQAVPSTLLPQLHPLPVHLRNLITGLSPDVQTWERIQQWYQMPDRTDEQRAVVKHVYQLHQEYLTKQVAAQAAAPAPPPLSVSRNVDSPPPAPTNEFAPQHLLPTAAPQPQPPPLPAAKPAPAPKKRSRAPPKKKGQAATKDEAATSPTFKPNASQTPSSPAMGMITTPTSASFAPDSVNSVGSIGVGTPLNESVVVQKILSQGSKGGGPADIARRLREIQEEVAKNPPRPLERSDLAPQQKQEVEVQMRSMLQMYQRIDQLLPLFFVITQDVPGTRRLLQMKHIFKGQLEGLQHQVYTTDPTLLNTLKDQIGRYFTFVKSNVQATQQAMQQRQPLPQAGQFATTFGIRAPYAGGEGASPTSATSFSSLQHGSPGVNPAGIASTFRPGLRQEDLRLPASKRRKSGGATSASPQESSLSGDLSLSPKPKDEKEDSKPSTSVPNAAASAAARESIFAKQRKTEIAEQNRETAAKADPARYLISLVEPRKLLCYQIELKKNLVPAAPTTVARRSATPSISSPNVDSLLISDSTIDEEQFERVLTTATANISELADFNLSSSMMSMPDLSSSVASAASTAEAEVADMTTAEVKNEMAVWDILMSDDYGKEDVDYYGWTKNMMFDWNDGIISVD